MTHKKSEEWTTIALRKELVSDIENAINSKIREGKVCGQLRISDSHNDRIRYLFEHWKQEILYRGAERRAAEKQLRETRKKEIVEAVKKLNEAVSDDEKG